MNDQEYLQTQNDLDVEIINLPPLDHDADTKHTSAHVPSYSSLKPRFSPRQRHLQLLITASIVVITLVMVPGSSLSVRNLATHLLLASMPTPTPTLAPGTDLFYINAYVPWAHVSLDGHPISRLPRIGIDSPFKLARGQHRLAWRAEPFPLQTCFVSVPLDIGAGLCLVNDAVQLKSGLTAWIINFTASLATLPDSQRTALIHTAQAALDAQQSTDIVQPGELDNAALLKQIFDIRQQPLRATLHFMLDTDPTSTASCRLNGGECLWQGKNCHVFCTDSNSMSTFPFFSVLAWNVFGVILPLWDFATLDGHTIARNQLDGIGGAAGDEFLLPLHITWESTGWHVTALFDNMGDDLFSDPTCGPARDEVQLDQTLRGAALNNTDVQWNFSSGPIHAAGCVAVATPGQIDSHGNMLTPSPHIVAYCLHRFGLLLAANDVAHRLWPYLPMADAYEQSLARQLAALAGIDDGKLPPDTTLSL